MLKSFRGFEGRGSQPDQGSEPGWGRITREELLLMVISGIDCLCKSFGVLTF
jgi:hypothetical protein